MKHKILYLLFILIPLFLIRTPRVFALSTCEANGGHCTSIFLDCAWGYLPAFDPSCTILSPRCCSDSPIPPPAAACTSDGKSGIRTALGCLITGDAKTFVGQILTWAVGIAGAVAFLVLVYAGFMIVTASGDPKRVKAGQELIGAALGGLVLIVLSLVLLNFLGVKILNLDLLGFSV